MRKIDLKYAFGLKPEEAIKYFKAKGYVFSWDWYEVWQEAHARAFTVAKVMRLDILQDIREELQKGLDDGITFADFKKNLSPKLRAKGWWGEVVNEETGEIATVGPHRLRTIFETNIQTSYQAAHYRQYMSNTTDRPWWMYVAVMDKRTRPSHSALNGLVFRFDDPFWNSHFPPNGYRCRCSVRALDDGGLAGKEAEGTASRRSTVGPDASAFLDTIEKPIGKTGLTAPVTSVVTRDLLGSRLALAPDVGWNYNTGKVDWQPDLNKYSPEIRALWGKS